MTAPPAWGDCHEGMNFAAIHELPVIFFCENNRYAISVPLSKQMAVDSIASRAEGYGMPGVVIDGTDIAAVYEATAEAANLARAGGGPTLIEAMVERYLPHTSDDDDTRYRPKDDIEEARKKDPVKMLRERLLAEGILDEATAERFASDARRAVNEATEQVEAAPASGRLDLLRPRLCRWYRRSAIAVMSVIEAVRAAMREELARDERVFVMGEDIGARGGVFLATDGFVEEFGEERVIDTPLAESSIAGIALGAAMNGMRPIAEIEFADFIWPTFNQVVGEAARVRYGTAGSLGVPMVLRAPYGGGVRGGLYHSQSPEAYFAHTPGLKVVAPATPYDTKGLLKSAVRDDDPVVFLEHKRTYRLVRGDVPDEEYTLPIGAADVKMEGSEISVISYGLMLHLCLEAARELADEGVSAEVVDLRTLRPLDSEAILGTARKTGKVLIVHEDTKAGGVGGEVAAVIAENAFEHLDGPIKRIAGPEGPGDALQPVVGGGVHAGHGPNCKRHAGPGAVLNRGRRHQVDERNHGQRAVPGVRRH